MHQQLVFVPVKEGVVLLALCLSWTSMQIHDSAFQQNKLWGFPGLLYVTQSNFFYLVLLCF